MHGNNNELTVAKNENLLIMKIIKKIKSFLYKGETNQNEIEQSTITQFEERINLIQEQYENYEIDILDLSEEEYEALINLYKKQIKQLQDKIEIKEKRLTIHMI